MSGDEVPGDETVEVGTAADRGARPWYSVLAERRVWIPAVAGIVVLGLGAVAAQAVVGASPQEQAAADVAEVVASPSESAAQSTSRITAGPVATASASAAPTAEPSPSASAAEAERPAEEDLPAELDYAAIDTFGAFVPAGAWSYDGAYLFYLDVQEGYRGLGYPAGSPHIVEVETGETHRYGDWVYGLAPVTWASQSHKFARVNLIPTDEDEYGLFYTDLDADLPRKCELQTRVGVNAFALGDSALVYEASTTGDEGDIDTATAAIYVRDLDDCVKPRNDLRVDATKLADGYAPSVSPDERSVAYAFEDAQGRRGYAVIPANGGAARTLVSPTVIADASDPTPVLTPAWSPSGDLVAVAAGSSAGNGDGVRVVKADGTAVAWIDTDGPARGLEFSPDGKWLSFRVGSSSESLWIARADGSGARAVHSWSDKGYIDIDTRWWQGAGNITEWLADSSGVVVRENDGSLLATGAISVVSTSGEVSNPAPHGWTYYGASFAPDGTALANVLSDLWQGEVLATVRAR